MKIFTAWRIFWLMFVLYLLPETAKSLPNIAIFSDNQRTPTFNHLAVNKSDGAVFIGAINRLYMLSSDLRLLDNVTTISDPNSMNYNKILVINELDQRLIACGCATDFACKIYSFIGDPPKFTPISQNKIPGMTKNIECVSTVAFIAYNNRGAFDNGFPKLYFAVSHSGYLSKQSTIAIQIFDLDSFEVDQRSGTFELDKFIIEYRDIYQVNYVYGFESGIYKYFLTTQRNSTVQESPYVSKLIRMCHGREPLSQGYAEIPMECKLSNDETYNLVQTATIGKPGLQLAKSLNISLNDSILFSIFSKVQKMKPTSNELSNHSALCIHSINAIDEKFNENIRNCFNGRGSRGFESTLQDQNCITNNRTIDSNFCTSEVNMPLVGNMPISASSVISFNNLSTAIATKPSENGSDVFIGTNTGHLKMLVLQDAWHAYDNADLVIDEEFPVTSDLLFSPQKDSLYIMSKRKLTKIKLELLNCSSYTTYASCLESFNLFCRWCGSINACTKKNDCSPEIKIAEKNFEHIQIGATETVQLYIPSISSTNVNVSIRCAFITADLNLYTFKQSSTNGHYNIHCPIPENLKIPSILKNEDYLNVNLSIDANHIWGSAHTNIAFVNCNKFTSCKTCVSLKIDCQWYSKEQKCVYNGKNIPKDASIISNFTSCENLNIKVPPNHTSSNTRNTSGNCLNLAKSCILCMNLDVKYDCGWCQSTNACESRDNCSGLLMKDHYSCPGLPSPIISSFQPLSGPWEGGTNITIEGESLFYKFDDEDTNERITVAGVTCTPYRDEYIPMKPITCIIEKSIASPGQEGPVVVYVNKNPVTSKQHFKFVDPKISEISPHSGPIYGGTELTIKGENLNVGKLIQVFIGDVLCVVFSLTSQNIKCVTNSSVERNSTVSMKFDQNIRNFTNDTFQYVKDSEHDEKGFNIEPKGIPAGGVTILIHPVVSLPEPELVFLLHNGNNTYESSCTLQNNSMFTCPSPYIPDIATDSIDPRNPKEMRYSVIDNVTKTSYKTSENEVPKFLLYPNPEFHYFLNSSFEIDEESFVIIKGKNINRTCQKIDIIVKVDNYTCDVISISSNQLICRLPKISSLSLINESEQKYEILANHNKITVTIGAHFKITLQKDKGFIPAPKEPIITYFIYGFIIFIAVILLLITSHFIIRKKIVTNHLKIVRKLQKQVNFMGMEAIALKQCMKRVIIKNQISLDEHSSKILKLPEVGIENTRILRASNGISAESEYILPLDDKWEFPKNNLTLGRYLGEGEFGKVIQGEAKNILKQNIITTVAVKMLKDNHSDEDMIDLVSEMEMMKLIGTHVNVLRLLGCCTKDGALFVITEYARHGNLRDFLRKHLPSDGEITATSLSQKKLIMFTLQVAKGMEYLASIKCIHRDLAARNVLVSENCVLKIADFGLARDVRNNDYYRKRTDGRLPVKWMAPESLCHRIYSTQSDVWSYGILLWEIFTLGGNPYPCLVDVGKLYQTLRSGYRMEKPHNCSVKMYSLMHKCWCFRPSDRPSFSTVVKNLEETLSTHKTLDRCHVYWPERNNSNDIEDETDLSK